MKIDGKVFLQVLKHVQRVTGAESVNVRARKGKLLIAAQNEGRSFMEQLDANGGEDDWSCAIKPADGFTRTLGGVVTLECDGSRVFIKASSYKGNFVVEPHKTTDFADFSNAPTLNAEQIAVLQEGYSNTRVSSILDQAAFEFVFDGKEFRCASWDRVHFSTFTKQLKTPKAAAKLTCADVDLIFGAVSDPTVFATDGGFLFMRGTQQKFSTPALQVEGEHGLAELLALRDGFNVPLCTINPSEFVLATDRATAACEQGQSVTLNFSKGKCTLTAKSNKGEYLEVLPVSGLQKSATFNIDPGAFIDTLGQAKADTVQIGVKEAFIWLAEDIDDGVHYMAVLSSQE